jgi:Bacterial protein of unknown function (DUF922)
VPIHHSPFTIHFLPFLLNFIHEIVVHYTAMIQKFLFVFISSLLFLSFTERDNEDYIAWSSDKKLSWDDFKMVSPSGTRDAALTTTYVGFSFSKSRDQIDFDIECKFQKSRSWGRLKNDYILKHEQGHFDIAEIFARKLNKEISLFLAKSKQHEELNKIYTKVMNEKRDMQQQYDDETNHSINKRQQAEWDNKIEEMLEELKEYDDY